MCRFVEKKEKSVVFSSTYEYYETTYTIFSTPSNPPYYSNTPPNINNYYNVQPNVQTPLLLFQPLLLFGTREYYVNWELAEDDFYLT